MFRALKITICFLVMTQLVWALPQGDSPSKSKAAAETQETVMRRKLTNAQNILEGLALNDFKKIQTSADELALLRQKAEWMAVKTPEYQVFTRDFQRNIESLQKAAKAKNIDAATLAYVDMTLTCVHCHNYVREVRTAGNRAPAIFDNSVAVVGRK